MEDQGKKQIKSIEDHEKRLVEFNELIKKDFNIGRDSIPLEELKKKKLMNLLKKDLLNLRTSKKNNLDNLIKELRKKKPLII